MDEVTPKTTAGQATPQAVAADRASAGAAMDPAPLESLPLDRTPLDRTPLDRARVEALAGPTGPLGSVTVLDSTGSTNDDLAAAAGGSADLSVIASEHQVSGRGRLGRDWGAPPRSSLAVSVLFKPAVFPPEAFGWLSMLCALSLVEALESLGATARIKWPNDVLLYRADAGSEASLAGRGPRKLAGLLAQFVPGGGPEDRPGVVVGAGINVDLTAGELPVPTATSLRHAGYDIGGTEVLVAYLEHLAARYRDFLEGSRPGGAGSGVAGLRNAVADRMATLGCEVRAELPDGSSFEGVARELGLDGGLGVETPGGARRTVHAADVLHLRRADGRYA
ncbi:biotin--[acetyl-CoA-carboxylase] ligase [Zhihengliuella sp.]|uniref:biotin--[acetyl-CoA-carboxylase] ligase n=1 Tax=Zhihengliuella sp. TaxID=1954483 RepID=UPI0028118962|nr:biotin--[acetyl-CoA-carboxylase] ligase [Zhihengliuella sp.]